MYNNFNNDLMVALERRKDEIAYAEEYRRWGSLPTHSVWRDGLATLLRAFRRIVFGVRHVRHTPMPVSREQELAHFHHFMHRNHNRHHAGLQAAR